MKKTEENEKKENKQTMIIMIIVIAVILAAAIAISYAFFTATIHTVGNTSVIVKTADIRIIYHQDNVLDIDNFFPGDSAQITFTVENQSNMELFYAIEWQDVATDTHFFETGDLVFELRPVGDSNGITIDRTATPIADAIIQDGISIAAGATHSYVLVVTYVYADDRNQIANIGATFLGRINITSSEQIRHEPTP